MERVGFGTRLLAFMIDVFAVGLPTMIIQLLFGAGFFAQVFLFFSFCAYTFLDVLHAQSPGKRLTGIKIYSANGERARNEALLNRWLIKLAPALIYFIGALTGFWLLTVLGYLAAAVFIGGFLMIMDDARQGLHDQITNTAVYRA